MSPQMIFKMPSGGSLDQYQCRSLSKITRMGILALSLVTITIFPYLLQQKWSSPYTNSSPPLVKIMDMQEQYTKNTDRMLYRIKSAYSNNTDTVFYRISSLYLREDVKEIQKFSQTVLGYKTMPDQCRRKAGLPKYDTISEYDLTKTGPYNFLPDYRNPCWHHSQTGKLRCLPYFFLAGFPKCGTTDMYQRIVAHPYVIHAGKEPHWFTRRRLNGRSLGSYVENYGNYVIKQSLGSEKKQSILGDASASTAWDNRVWPNLPGNEGCSEPQIITADYVRYTNPHAKIIMMLRNPTTRLYSAYLFFKKRTPKSQKTFHELVKESIAIFHACVARMSVRYCAYNASLYTTRLQVGLYSVFIEDWLLRFPREQMLFIRLEDVHMGTEVMPIVYKFLGLEPLSVAAMEKVAKLRRRNVGRVSSKMGPMWNQTRALLDSFYRPFNARLAQILQNRRFSWEDE